ncbi:MAG TPA: hypothetical protein VEX43_16785 [Chthoniobacterales bacterium]|nr:hypothetical protein [Chthoniobacterales bacterium]
MAPRSVRISLAWIAAMSRLSYEKLALKEEYEELLQDLDDLAGIARRKNEPTIPLAEVKRRLKNNGALSC